MFTAEACERMELGQVQLSWPFYWVGQYLLKLHWLIDIIVMVIIKPYCTIINVKTPSSKVEASADVYNFDLEPRSLSRPVQYSQWYHIKVVTRLFTYYTYHGRQTYMLWFINYIIDRHKYGASRSRMMLLLFICSLC